VSSPGRGLPHAAYRAKWPTLFLYDWLEYSIRALTERVGRFFSAARYLLNSQSCSVFANRRISGMIRAPSFSGKLFGTIATAPSPLFKTDWPLAQTGEIGQLESHLALD